MVLDLSTIHYSIPKERKNKKIYSLEEHFLMSQMQPATSAPNIKNQYFLSVRSQYDGCTCCSGLPHARIPLTIVPVEPQFYPVQQPMDFSPIAVGVVV